MTLVFNNFWVEFWPAICALLRGDMPDFAKQSSVLFPSQAKCDYFNFGSSGTIQHIDALCLLPQNVVNEKVCRANIFSLSLHWFFILYRFSLSFIFGCWFSCYSPCFTSFASSSNFVTIVGRAMISDIASSYRLWRKISARFSLMTFSKLAKSTLTRFSVKIWMCAFNDDAPKFIWHSMSKFIWKRDYKFTNTDFST